MRRRGVLLTLAAVAGLSLPGCSSPITAAKLQADVGPTFARMYTAHQQRIGAPDAVPGPDGHATCYRYGPHPYSGAGDYWLCTVQLPTGDGRSQKVYYEVTVAPTGCFTADGPSGFVGPQTLTTPHGEVVNPLFAFDGCLDL